MTDERLRQLSEKALETLLVDASPEAGERLKAGLEHLAAELFLEWLTGERRFESQTQQSEYWLSRFYEEMFPDEQPDGTVIYERFGLPLPRANYIARLLRTRRAAQWRTAARKELVAALAANRAGAEAAKEDGAGIEEIDISLSAGAADELRVQLDRYSATVAPDERPRPPKAKPSLGTTRWFAVPAETLLALLGFLQKGERP
ncbi:hypothetical protein [Neorhizobium alkalisoli]|uniref:hypothetical protein n=1 Tax=Neorhizobium alkalisoli TaxID=528178 RepID=UPI000CF969AF|nr:hypothetical protein [Neorhizobium alkalisoli]